MKRITLLILGVAASLAMLLAFFAPAATPALADDPYMDANVPSSGMSNKDIEAMNQHEIAWLISQNQVMRDAYQVETDFQHLIDQMKGGHGDATPLDVALGRYDTALLVAQDVHDQGAKLIGAQFGFNAKGKVTNREAALATVTNARYYLRDTHYRLLIMTKALRHDFHDWLLMIRP